MNHGGLGVDGKLSTGSSSMMLHLVMWLNVLNLGLVMQYMSYQESVITVVMDLGLCNFVDGSDK